MSRYEPGILPPAEAPILAEVLERELRELTDYVRHRLDLETEREVRNPEDGMLRYFDATVYNPGEGTGLYVFTAGVWRRLAYAVP